MVAGEAAVEADRGGGGGRRGDGAPGGEQGRKKEARGRGGAGARTGGARDGGKKRLSVGEEGPRRALYIKKGL